MSHQLSLVNNKYEFVKFGDKAWHGLGTYIKEPMTSQEAMEKANLGWQTLKEPLYLKRGDSFIESLEFKATVRSDTQFHLGCVRPTYVVIQNTDVFKILDDILEGTEAVIHTAGALNQGRRIFFTAKLPEYISVNGEVIDEYLVITNSHNGNTALRIMFTPICVVCNNTLQIAIKQSKKYAIIKHTKNVNNKLKDVNIALGIINEFKHELNTLAEELMYELDVPKFFEKFVDNIPVLKNAKRTSYVKVFNDEYIGGIGSDLECRQNTAWGAYNAITGFFCNKKEYSSKERKFIALTEGHSYSIMKAAQNMLRKPLISLN